jgi:hypothetical protein
LARGTPKGRKAQTTPPEDVEEALPPEVEEPDPRERERRVPSDIDPGRDSPSPVASRSDRVPLDRKFPRSHGADAILYSEKPALARSGQRAPRDSEDQDMDVAAASVRAELFGGGTLKELRKAIVHQEVLGKPVALRDES